MSYIVKKPFFDKEEKIYYSKIGEPFPKGNIKDGSAVCQKGRQADFQYLYDCKRGK